MTRPADLLFDRPAGASPHLLFGDDGPPTPATVTAVLAGALPAPTLTARVGTVERVVLSARLPGPTLTVRAQYRTQTNRPLVRRADAPWQVADALAAGGATVSQQDARPDPAGTAGYWQTARALQRTVQHLLPDRLVSTVLRRAAGHQDGSPLGTRGTVGSQDATRAGLVRGGRHQDATPLGNTTGFRHQDTTRAPRLHVGGRHQGATPLSLRLHTQHQVATPYDRWLRGRHQEAMVPPPGKRGPPIPPEPIPCYTPSPHLLFAARRSADGNLLFVCDHAAPGPGPNPDEPVVVPVRKVYFVQNNAWLRRLSDGALIHTPTLSLSLDVDSWTWSFSATVPFAAYGLVTPTTAGPTEMLCSVNGIEFRVLAESLSRERTFGSDWLRVSGRGRTALLDAPYSPVLNLFEDNGLTSQQLAEWVLQDNGVPLGWDVDWRIDPWFVPGGVFAHQGSYMGALGRIAEAAGAYIQPHDTQDKVFVLPRYPSAPWEWSAVTADILLPSAVVEREATDWQNLPYYNRVYVRGEAQGITGRVTRAGSAGDRLAPAVVDPLITHAVAARQRGISILSHVGRVTTVGLKLPVLQETGIIRPGKFVRYEDAGASRMGIVRSVSVQVDFPTVWQSIAVETHDEPV